MTALSYNTFKPARALGILPAERAALIKTLKVFESEDLGDHFDMRRIIDASSTSAPQKEWYYAAKAAIERLEREFA